MYVTSINIHLKTMLKIKYNYNIITLQNHVQWKGSNSHKSNMQ